MAAGKTHYMTNCMPCHGAAGEGTIGPNLTDESWVHGGSDDAIIKTIAVGVAAKGMPGWKAVLGQKKVEQVAAYVISLQGSNPANGKAAEGEVFKREN